MHFLSSSFYTSFKYWCERATGENCVIPSTIRNRLKCILPCVYTNFTLIFFFHRKETHAYRARTKQEREKLKILIHRIVHRSQIHLLFRRVDWNAPKKIKYNQIKWLILNTKKVSEQRFFPICNIIKMWYINFQWYISSFLP